MGTLFRTETTLRSNPLHYGQRGEQNSSKVSHEDTLMTLEKIKSTTETFSE